MGKLRTYWSQWRALSASRRRQFLKASVCLISIKLALHLFSFSVFKRLFGLAVKQVPSRSDVAAGYLDDTVWAVRSAAYHLPLSLMCLPQALAVKYLLRGLPGLSLHIGVQQNATDGFAAHAWIESSTSGSIIIGDWPQTVSYRPLWVWV
ncbi:hypothetical protein GCM10027275_08890 [Rhabdobacter roseus]|uniref:Microcin J25-processing protein McjB C-terminal domain-containing protein n=1 Tax=Rhabdobacter roseus TaxID=1655419 RepID=A0A840TSY3_9BACT|nr:lasso peptide biosynthesis B2 protein [Rhabdobacter roseus]MBB5282789.1 hypothetical protein [Rhabdobacter roseus]